MSEKEVGYIACKSCRDPADFTGKVPKTGGGYVEDWPLCNMHSQICMVVGWEKTGEINISSDNYQAFYKYLREKNQ